jgi:hypothetical protein
MFLQSHTFAPERNQTRNIDKTEIELKGNSSNAKYCVYPVQGGDSIVIKVQMDEEADPIVRDIYIQNLVDEANNPKSLSLMTGRGYHVAHLKEDEDGKYYYLTDASVSGGMKRGQSQQTTPVNSGLLMALDDAFKTLKTLEEGSANVVKSKVSNSDPDFDLDGFASKVLEEIKSRPHVDKRQKLQSPRFISMKRPCMLVTNVNNTITFGELLRNHEYSMSTPFCRLIRDLIAFSNKTGFTHNDMHIANILYDTKKEYFTLIDYGRANFNTTKFKKDNHEQHIADIQKALLKGYDNFMLHKIVLGATAADPQGKQKRFREDMFNDTYTYNTYVCVEDYLPLHMMHDLAGLTKSVLAQLDFFTLPMYRTFSTKYVETRWQQIRSVYETSTVRSQIVNRFKKLDILLTQCLGQNDEYITKLVNGTLTPDFCSNHFAFALAPGYFWMISLERTGVKPEALWRIPAAKHFHKLEPVIFNKLFGTNPQQGMEHYAENIKKCIQIFVNVWMDKCNQLLLTDKTGNTMTTTKQQGGVQQDAKYTYSLIDDIVFAADNRDTQTPKPEDLEMIPNFASYVSWAEKAEKHMLNVVTRAKDHISKKSSPYPDQNAACIKSNTTKNLANAFAKCSHVNVPAPAAGGATTSHKSYTIKLERKTQRKYIVKSSKKWYLDEHRNQYRYADAQKTSLTLRTSTKYTPPSQFCNT